MWHDAADVHTVYWIPYLLWPSPWDNQVNNGIFMTINKTFCLNPQAMHDPDPQVLFTADYKKET